MSRTTEQIEAIKNDIAGIKTELEAIKKQSDTKELYEKLDMSQMELSKILSEIEASCREIVKPGSNVDILQKNISDAKTHFTSIAENFKKFSDGYQLFTEKQNVFLTRIENMTDFMVLPGIKITWITKFLRTAKKTLVFSANMLIGIGVYELIKLIWTLAQNQN
jgi:predicted nuclease with TOPRIM domain